MTQVSNTYAFKMPKSEFKRMFTAEFDLCDEINCQLRKVSYFEPHTSGFNVFQADLMYLIVTFQRRYMYNHA